MKTIIKHLALALAALAAAGFLPASSAPAPEKVSVPLSSPDKPCSITVDVYLGSITVRQTFFVRRNICAASKMPKNRDECCNILQINKL